MARVWEARNQYIYWQSQVDDAVVSEGGATTQQPWCARHVIMPPFLGGICARIDSHNPLSLHWSCTNQVHTEMVT